MTDQKKTQNQPVSDIETPEESHEEQQPEQHEQHDRLKETTEKIWGGTKHVWSAATFKANQYKKLVQKKIDQSALHKKIHVAHADLGKLIDDLREAGEKDILNLLEVKEILKRIDELKAEAATIEAEVEQIRAEEPSQVQPHEETQEQDKSN
ncbi:MAG: hypothetical protein IH613_03290 [Desulfuromonadales bacterium]|nr:hypothetical protein [Desulfuromonadales bacterium]